MRVKRARKHGSCDAASALGPVDAIASRRAVLPWPGMGAPATAALLQWSAAAAQAGISRLRPPGTLAPGFHLADYDG
jgi:hypothetical protein